MSSNAFNRKRATPGFPSADVESLQRQNTNSSSPNSSSVNQVRVLLKSSVGGDDHCGGMLKLLQDIVSGIILGTLGMCMLLLLDYYSIINLETARVFRKTASHVFSTPEIHASIEEEIGKQLISMNIYNTIINELSDSEAIIANEKRIYEARSTKATSLKDELDTLRVEYDKLIKDTGLDVFCPSCPWGMGLNCQQRVNYMLENYSDTATTIECISKLVTQGKTNGKCINN